MTWVIGRPSHLKSGTSTHMRKAWISIGKKESKRLKTSTLLQKKKRKRTESRKAVKHRKNTNQTDKLADQKIKVIYLSRPP